MFINEITNEYSRINNLLQGDKLQTFYKNISLTYIPLFIKELNVIDLQIIEVVTKYLFLIKIERLTYEDMYAELMVNNASSYVIEESIFCIKLILNSEEFPKEWIISHIRLKPLIFFLYLCYYYTSFSFSLIRLSKYEYISFYEKYFAYNFLEDQKLFVQFFSCLSEMNKKVI